MSDTPKATIGRIVHVVLRAATVPAIVTAVLDDAANHLAVTAFPPARPPVALEVSYHDADEPPAGTWHWPPR